MTLRFIYLEGMLPTNKAKVSAFFFLSLISIFFFQRFK
jgi:hypothetical protein